MLDDERSVDDKRDYSATCDAVGVVQSANETQINLESQAYRELIERSLLNKGNNVRLKRAIEKARTGEPVYVAYIGGSITQGAGAVPIHLQCYAYRSYEQFKKRYAPSDGGSINLIKAGVGGTPSELGIIRYDRDVLLDGQVQPDILIIEFAVNDADDETKGNCYESLVIKALAADNKPAVILLFSVFENDWNLQDRLAPVGWHYDLPMVSMKDALVEQFQKTPAEGRVITKEQFFHDIYHPTNLGHRIMADALSHLFNVTDHSALDQVEQCDDRTPLIGNDFVNVKLLDRKNVDHFARIEVGAFRHTDTDLQMAEMHDHEYGTLLFPNNWMYNRTSTQERNRFTLYLRCKRLILIFKDSSSAEFGTANIRVDDEYIKQADPHQVNWTHCHAMLLFNDNEVSERKIEIEMAEGYEDNRFTILGFGYVD